MEVSDTGRTEEQAWLLLTGLSDGRPRALSVRTRRRRLGHGLHDAEDFLCGLARNVPTQKKDGGLARGPVAQGVVVGCLHEGHLHVAQRGRQTGPGVG